MAGTLGTCAICWDYTVATVAQPSEAEAEKNESIHKWKF